MRSSETTERWRLSVELLAKLAVDDINVLDIRPLSRDWQYSKEEGCLSVAFEYRKVMPTGAKWAKAVLMLRAVSYESAGWQLIEIIEDTRKKILEDPFYDK